MAKIPISPSLLGHPITQRGYSFLHGLLTNDFSIPKFCPQGQVFYKEDLKALERVQRSDTEMVKGLQDYRGRG